MLLFIEAERPEQRATAIIALPLSLPGADPDADTAVVPRPLPRKPIE